MSLWTATIKSTPFSFRAYHNRANEWIELKQYSKARADLKKAVKINPQDPHLYYTLGRVFDADGMLDSAIASYTISLLLQPFDFNARINRGIDYLLMKKYREALADFEKCVKLDANHYYA